MSPPQLNAVDDRDPRLTYNPDNAWFHSGKAGSEFKGTTTFTKAANATVVFNFYGTGVAVFGSVSSNTNSSVSSTIPPQSSYTVDGGTSLTFSPPLIDDPQRSVPFFADNSLAPGNHTLVITTLTPGGFFCLDRLDLPPGGSPLPPSPGDFNQTGSSHGVSESVPPQGATDSPHKVGVGTLVVAVLGSFGLIFLAASIFVTYKYYQKRYGKRKPEIHIFRDSRSVAPPNYTYNL